jgi:hypothetical protein
LEKVHQKETTPQKRTKGRKKQTPVPFIAAVLPDNEDQDEEYDPAKDIQSPDCSDDESMASASDTGTPSQNSSFLSPSTSVRSSASIETPHSTSAQKAGGSGGDESMFKKPDETSSVVRSLNFDSAQEAAALRQTRSKANLTEVSIEELETNFVPPDITEDMYDNVIDDYRSFLSETFGKPVENQEKAEEKIAAEEGEDPDFVYQEHQEQEQDDLFDVIDEYKFNRSTKIPQKEADLLMHELFEAYDLNQKSQQSQHRGKVAPGGSGGSSGRRSAEPQTQQDHSAAQQLVNFAPYQAHHGELTNDQRLLLAQQMRQHIQLATQMALLTSKEPQWQELYSDSRTMLAECMSKSFERQYSVYAQDNLFSSMAVLDEWDSSACLPAIGMYQYAQSAHATIFSVLTQPLATLLTFPLIIPWRYVSIATLLTLPTEHIQIRK